MGREDQDSDEQNNDDRGYNDGGAHNLEVYQ
jgi:hypothetical protein